MLAMPKAYIIFVPLLPQKNIVSVPSSPLDIFMKNAVAIYMSVLGMKLPKIMLLYLLRVRVLHSAGMGTLPYRIPTYNRTYNHILTYLPVLGTVHEFSVKINMQCLLRNKQLYDVLLLYLLFDFRIMSIYAFKVLLPEAIICIFAKTLGWARTKVMLINLFTQ